jgi:hypothetical protein
MFAVIRRAQAVLFRHRSSRASARCCPSRAKRRRCHRLTGAVGNEDRRGVGSNCNETAQNCLWWRSATQRPRLVAAPTVTELPIFTQASVPGTFTKPAPYALHDFTFAFVSGLAASGRDSAGCGLGLVSVCAPAPSSSVTASVAAAATALRIIKRDSMVGIIPFFCSRETARLNSNAVKVVASSAGNTAIAGVASQSPRNDRRRVEMPSPVARYGCPSDLDVLPLRTGAWIAKVKRIASLPVSIPHDAACSRGTYWGTKAKPPR